MVVSISFVLMAFSVAYVSGIAAGRISKIGKGWLTTALGFGGGFLLAVALVDLIPEAAERAGGAYMAAALGFAGFFLVEQLFDAHFCPVGEAHCSKSHGSTGLIALVGMGIHGLIDGLAVAGALVADERLAVVVTTAVLVHKIPDGFCLGVLLAGKEYPTNKINKFLAVFALSTPVGFLLARYAVIGSLNPGVALGLSAGSFIYIATSHLLPEAGDEASDTGPLVLSVVVGVAMAVALQAFE